MKYSLMAGSSALAVLASASTLAIGLSSPALAGDVILTGHDNDYHCDAGDAGGACEVLKAEVNYVANGSALPVLAIDAGGELTSSLTADGINYVAVAPSAVTGAMFNHSDYSAFVVASVTSCGGCDNPPGTGTQLAAFEPEIASFFNSGGGILGLAGAGDPDAYAYVPEAGGTTTPIFSSSGFTATPAGLANIPGFFAVNGDETHNTFSDFGSFYTVGEVFNPTGGTTGPAVTIFGNGGTIGCTGSSCHIVSGAPEPSTWAMLGLGVFGIGLALQQTRRRRPLLEAA